MRKRGVIVLLFIIGLAGSLHAQQLTRFAVVDLLRVYTAFFRESRAARELEERSARVQNEIDRMTAEIQNLYNSMVDAQTRGDEERSLRLQSEIYRKQDFLREYHQVKTAELEDQKRKLAQSNSFMEQISDEIRFIAESEGYSMVLNQKENTGILWFSPSVDITDKLITNLRNKAGR
ncbi:cationic outer membrane protein [Treponema primitia ZAS-2]|uniref:Cationic outer membrane protein n=1 Tax=Treponema primitia (strain ATCC BAA-887 / DSM 12427 / ZAS-2) TaxID=545694 RepID=F5YRA1_TREPZ|nr:OmpH family outer membrane protein [Treponema primitia]AEF84659.1 cationic outer membrane protein [Treponema primitia ZAS-2]